MAASLACSCAILSVSVAWAGAAEEEAAVLEVADLAGLAGLVEEAALEVEALAAAVLASAGSATQSAGAIRVMSDAVEFR